MRTNVVVDEFYVKPVSMKAIAHTIRDLCSDLSGTAQCEATRNEVWIDSPAVTGQVQTVH